MTNSLFKMNNMSKACSNCPKPNYLKVATGGNDPSLTKAQRYSQYVQTTKSKSVAIDKNYTPPPPPERAYSSFRIVTLNSDGSIRPNTGLSKLFG